MTIRPASALIAFIALVVCVGGVYLSQHRVVRISAHHSQRPIIMLATPQPTASFDQTIETEHYTIASTATAADTRAQAKAVESLFTAYTSFIAGTPERDKHLAKLKLVLYRNRQEFRAHSTASPWAEAYYSAPVCYAYVDAGQPNPYHWMIHEGTHQLNDQVAHFRIAKWANEGLASYFGTSRIDAQGLHPGVIDVHTYPIWWLSSLSLSGNLQRDIDDGKLIALRAIVSGNGGPAVDTHVNLYYIEYWSLSHFLFHYRNGQYAGRYRKLIDEGGSLQGFERIVGPMDRIQGEWYGYLQQEIAEVGNKRAE